MGIGNLLDNMGRHPLGSIFLGLIFLLALGIICSMISDIFNVFKKK